MMTSFASTTYHTAPEYGIPYTNTFAAAKATLKAIRTLKEGTLEVKSLQEYHEMVWK